MHTLVGGGGQHGGFNALDYRKIKQGNADPLGTFAILSVLPDKFARFLFECHSGRFERLDLPILPDDRSYFDVHGALEDDKVKKLRINMSYLIHMMHMNTVIILIIPIIAIMLINASFIIISKSLHPSTPFLWICSICSWPSGQVHLLGVC